jgi:hypothetical protein
MWGGTPMTQEGSRAEKLAVPPLLEADTFLGLTTTFLNAVNAFNRQEVRKIEEALADNAILYKVTNGTPVSGKAAIIGYLEAKVMQDKPVFVPVTISLHPPSLPTSLRGAAYWRSSDKPAASTLPVHYEFHFQSHAPYLITSMWATAG